MNFITVQDAYIVDSNCIATVTQGSEPQTLRILNKMKSMKARLLSEPGNERVLNILACIFRSDHEMKQR